MFFEHTFIDIFKNVVANPNLNVVNVYIRHRSSEGAAVALSFSGSIAKFVKQKTIGIGHQSTLRVSESALG